MSWFTSLRDRVEAVVIPSSLGDSIRSKGATDFQKNTQIGKVIRDTGNVAAVAAGAYFAAPYLAGAAGSLGKVAAPLLGSLFGGGSAPAGEGQPSPFAEGSYQMQPADMGMRTSNLMPIMASAQPLSPVNTIAAKGGNQTLLYAGLGLAAVLILVIGLKK